MYKTIVVAVDFSSNPAIVIEKAVDVGKSMNAEIHLVHVMDDHSHFYDVIKFPSMLDVDFVEVRQRHYDHLKNLGAQYHINEANCHLLTTGDDKGFVDLAHKIDADLVVAGSHGRHGISLLIMGSMADNLLHHSDIDLLAVRVPK